MAYERLRTHLQNTSFELSKSAFGHFFTNFTIRRDPSDLGQVKISGKEKAGSKLKRKTVLE